MYGIVYQQRSIMSNVYALRIHELADDCRSRIASFVESSGGSYVVAREADANRIHYQGWLRCDVKPQALRARLKKAFPECVGNKGYSISNVKDFDAYSRYILKGTKDSMADVVCACGLEITSEYLQNEHRAYWSRAEKPGKSNRSLVEEVHEWVIERQRTQEVSRRDIAERVCEAVTSRKKPLNTFYVRSVVNSVAYLSNRQMREIILDEIINKY